MCAELERLIREGGPQDLATLKRHTLLNTIYKKVHAKTAVTDLVNRGKVRQVRSGRSDADRIYDVGAEVVTQSAMLF